MEILIESLTKFSVYRLYRYYIDALSFYCKSYNLINSEIIWNSSSVFISTTFTREKVIQVYQITNIYIRINSSELKTSHIIYVYGGLDKGLFNGFVQHRILSYLYCKFNTHFCSVIQLNMSFRYSRTYPCVSCMR